MAAELLEKTLRTFPSISSGTTRLDYVNRLRSYKPSLYFAKPSGLGPECAARWGYSCTGVDEISCSECGAQVCVRIDDTLGEDEAQKVAEALKGRLREAHEEFCRHRWNPAPETYLSYPPTNATWGEIEGRCQALDSVFDEGVKVDYGEEVDGSVGEWRGYNEGVVGAACCNWRVDEEEEERLYCDCCGATVPVPKAGEGEVFMALEGHRYYCPVAKGGLAMSVASVRGERGEKRRRCEEGGEGEGERETALERTNKLLRMLNG